MCIVYALYASVMVHYDRYTRCVATRVEWSVMDESGRPCLPWSLPPSVGVVDGRVDRWNGGRRMVDDEKGTAGRILGLTQYAIWTVETLIECCCD